MSWLSRQSSFIRQAVAERRLYDALELCQQAIPTLPTLARHDDSRPAAIDVALRIHSALGDHEAVERLAPLATSGEVDAAYRRVMLSRGVLLAALEGVEQTSLVRILDARPSEVRELCRDMADLGLISRERSGSSYRIDTKDPPLREERGADT